MEKVHFTVITYSSLTTLRTISPSTFDMNKPQLNCVISRYCCMGSRRFRFLLMLSLIIFLYSLSQCPAWPADDTMNRQFFRNSDEGSRRVFGSEWFDEKWWLIENRFNFYLNDFRLLRDKMLMETIIGDQGDLNIRTQYVLKALKNDLVFLRNQLMLRYFPINNLRDSVGPEDSIDPYLSYPFTMYFEGREALKLRREIIDIIQDELDAEAQLDILALLISRANNYETDWITVRNSVIGAEWSTAIFLSLMLFSQNDIDMGVVMPLLRTADYRFAALVNVKKFGEAFSPTVESGFIHENKLFAMTALVRQRYGSGELYTLIKETLRIKFESDLFSRSYLGNYLKVKWQNIIERSIKEKRAKVEGDKGPFTYLHEYTLRINYFNNSRKTSRDYAIRIRFLDLRTNTLSVIIPAVVLRRISGMHHVIGYDQTITTFLEGGYGTPFSLQSSDDIDRGVHLLVGIRLTM